MTTTERGINRRKLRAIGQACCDADATDAIDRVVARGPVSKEAVARIARQCCDPDATDALDALLYRTGSRA